MSNAKFMHYFHLLHFHFTFCCGNVGLRRRQFDLEQIQLCLPLKEGLLPIELQCYLQGLVRIGHENIHVCVSFEVIGSIHIITIV